ncbi:MAG: chromosomal replication initiator protein DnaA [Lachnospiraceae bacterium]|nr:chromosomal replication initiator protein DnaA [Lachnospiraceae bacterium]
MDDFDLLRSSWPEILDTLKKEPVLTSVSFNSWIKPLIPQKIEQGELFIIVPEGMMAISVLNKKYLMLIRVAIEEVTGLSLRIRFVAPDPSVKDDAKESREENAFERAHLNPKYTFDTFVVGNNSKFAYSAALAVAEQPGEVFNPLYLYSGVGLGKTHLMHSIAHFILENDPSKRVLYVTSETFTNELIDAIRNRNNQALSEFRDRYRNIDVLLIDDIQFIIGKESTQEEFFHTFNALYGAKKQVIVSSDKPPRELDILEERIRSRLEMGLTADISRPDYETRMAILRKMQETEGFRLGEEIMDYIASNITSNIRILEGCFNRIKAKSLLEKREVDLSIAEDILKDFISPEKERRITADMIVDAVSEHFHLTREDLTSRKRNSEIAYPRKVAMYLCRELTTDSQQAIAQILARTDHTTVISACRSIEKKIQTSDETKRDVDVIRKKLNSGV